MENKEERLYYDEHGEEISKKEYRATVAYRVVILVLIVAAILLAWFRPCHCNCHIDDKASIPWDNNVTYDDDAKQADVDALNQKVADGMITISMNADPVFQNGSSEGSVNIENDVSNTRPQMIEIYLKDENGNVDKNKLVYRSGKIPVGGKIPTVELSTKLSKGDYPAWVGFNAISDDDEIVGTAGADIVIHVLN